MLILSVTWMFMAHRNLIHSASNLNGFSNTFSASVLKPWSCRLCLLFLFCHLGQFHFEIFLEACLVFQTFNYLSGMWSEGRDQREKERSWIRHLKKIIQIWNRHFFKKKRKRTLITWVGSGKITWCRLGRSNTLSYDVRQSSVWATARLLFDID